MTMLTPQENNELDSKIISLDRRAAVKKFGLTVTPFAELGKAPHKKHLVHNFLGAGELSCLFGPPGSAKSALAGDIAAYVAWGEKWFGRRVLQGGVLFVAAERAALVKRRLFAFRLRHDIPDIPLCVISGGIDLRSNATSTDGIIDCAKRWLEDTGIETRLIVGDTVSRLLAGGDENSPKDIGAFVGNVSRIQEATGAHVLLVHHVPHEQNRMRGHGSLLAACDTTIRIEKTGSIRTATVEKNNDGEEGASVAFNLESIEIGKDPETQEPTTAPVVAPAEIVIPQAGETRLKKNHQTMYSILRAAGAGGLTLEEWNEASRAEGIGVGRKADLYDIRASLKGKNLVREFNGHWNAV